MNLLISKQPNLLHNVISLQHIKTQLLLNILDAITVCILLFITVITE